MFGEDAGAAAREKIWLIILNKIESFLKFFHSKHRIGAHSVCGNNNVAAYKIKVVLVIAQHVDLVGLQWNEGLINNTFVQRAYAAWLVVPLELGMNPDCAFVTTAFQIINRSENGHMATEARREIGYDPMDVQRFGVGISIQRPVLIQLLGFEMNNLFKALDFQFIFAFNN